MLAHTQVEPCPPTVISAPTSRRGQASPGGTWSPNLVSPCHSVKDLQTETDRLHFLVYHEGTSLSLMIMIQHKQYYTCPQNGTTRNDQR